jgi:hypothetical protein
MNYEFHNIGKVVLYQLSYSRFIQSVRILHTSIFLSITLYLVVFTLISLTTYLL